jgi:hypothetical protein
LIIVNDPALKDRPIRFQELAQDLQAQPVQPGKRGHIRVSKSRVSHVEVFRMSGVGTFILGGPRPLTGQRRARTTYTLNYEEPLKPPNFDERQSPTWKTTARQVGFCGCRVSAAGSIPSTGARRRNNCRAGMGRISSELFAHAD